MKRNRQGQFENGTHWRAPKPFWDKAWLYVEYVDKKRSCAEIASEFGVTENAIQFWLKKHGITGRSVSEARIIKHWGSRGDANPMYGKRGILNPNWKGGLTPLRQKIYAKSEWRAAARSVRTRDGSCRLCGSKEKTVIHHIDPFSQSPLLVMDIGNLILLCDKCHRRLRGREMHWRKRLYRLLERRETV